MREIAGRILTAAIVGLGVAATPLLTGPARATDAPVSVSATYAAQAVRATNRQRKAAGLVTLKQSACLQRYAIGQAERMAMQKRMFHQKLSPILRGCGLTLVGENVAVGFPTGKRVVTDGWMQSAPHRANILDARYRLIAVAARQDARGVWYASQLFARS